MCMYTYLTFLGGVDRISQANLPRVLSLLTGKMCDFPALSHIFFAPFKPEIHQ